MMLSGFTFVHNAIEGGYPIVEAIAAVQPFVDEIVIVDMQSTDGTRRVLDDMGARPGGIRIIDGRWGNAAGETLRAAHALNAQCRGEIIVHFEADEVYDPRLLADIVKAIEAGHYNIAVWRLQLEQNFQRCRWYPELVHRIFPRGSVTKVGHTTDREHVAWTMPPEAGYLWDITNCFRDNWLQRIRNQAELWNEEPRYRAAPRHFLQDPGLEDVERFLKQEHWTWMTTPFAIPDTLRPLVGMTKYEVRDVG